MMPLVEIHPRSNQGRLHPQLDELYIFLLWLVCMHRPYLHMPLFCGEVLILLGMNFMALLPFMLPIPWANRPISLEREGPQISGFCLRSASMPSFLPSSLHIRLMFSARSWACRCWTARCLYDLYGVPLGLGWRSNIGWRMDGYDVREDFGTGICRCGRTLWRRGGGLRKRGDFCLDVDYLGMLV